MSLLEYVGRGPDLTQGSVVAAVDKVKKTDQQNSSDYVQSPMPTEATQNYLKGELKKLGANCS